LRSYTTSARAGEYPPKKDPEITSAATAKIRPFIKLSNAKQATKIARIVVAGTGMRHEIGMTPAIMFC
jgi:hypothetical protein